MIKSILPRSLFGRALLILIVPVILVQIIAAVFFYERHWDTISRHKALALAREVSYIYALYALTLDESGLKEAQHAARKMGMKLTIDESQSDIVSRSLNTVQPHTTFFEQLKKKLNVPFLIRDGEKEFQLRILLDNDTMVFTISRKRLVSITTNVYIYVMVGTSLVLLCVAILFLRNQIRPIVQLAKAAERFGTGRDIEHYIPRGAREVRMAGTSFLRMKDRITRQVETRTQMLAGISHDLRTPLTRMKLELAMAGKSPESLEHLHKDIEQMEHMVEEYLDFARGSAGEKPLRIALDKLLEEIAGRYQQHDKDVTFQFEDALLWVGRPNALRRALQNVIDNALRYGRVAHVSMRHTQTHVYITIEDNGPGVEEAQMEDMFQPFKRMDSARNLSEAGVGLGLTIARDTVHGHGGRITLENMVKDDGARAGLRVTIKLPRDLSFEE